MKGEDIVFRVQGSADEPYKVTFVRNGSNVNAYCTCPAGENGQCCKHRFAIMAGDSTAVVSANGDQASIVHSWLPGSDLEESLMELAEAQHLQDEAKKRLSLAKKGVAQTMHR